MDDVRSFVIVAYLHRGSYLGLLHGKEDSTQVEAAYALCRIDVRSRRKYLGNIAAGLSDKAAAVRYRAAACIHKLAPEAGEAIPALLNTLKDHDASVRLMTCNALGAMGHRAATAIPALTVAAENDENKDVRRAATQAIGAIPQSK